MYTHCIYRYNKYKDINKTEIQMEKKLQKRQYSVIDKQKTNYKINSGNFYLQKKPYINLD